MIISRAIQDYLTHLRLFSKNTRLFLTGTFFMGMGFSGFYLLFNLYLKEIGFAESKIGTIISLSTIGTIATAIPASLFLKNRRVKMVLTITTPLTVGFSLLQILLPRYLIIIIAGTCAGIAMTFFQVAAAPFLMRYSGPQERPYLFSLNFALSLLAGILGSLVGGILPEIIRRTGVNLIPAYQITLIIFGGLVLVAVIPYLSIEEKQNLTNNHELKIEQDTNWSIIIKLFLPTFLVGLGAGLSIPFINLYFRDRFHLHSGVIGTYFAINQGLMITGLLLSPPLAQRFGKISVVIGSQLLSIPFLIAMGLTYYLPLAVVSFLFRATLMNMAQPLVTNFAMEAVRE
ncbi:MAG: MFS transporter, partial [candidate division WOR-3 bacterium]